MRGSGAGHPVAQREDGYVVFLLRLHGCCLSGQQHIHVLPEEGLEAAGRLEPAILQDPREPLGKLGEVVGHRAGGEADADYLREVVDEGEPVGERVAGHKPPKAREEHGSGRRLRTGKSSR